MLDFPANPTQGQVYENWSWDGTKWTPISTGGGATFSISDTPPSSPQGNTLWWDSVGGQLYVWYNDGNTTQWVPTTNLLGGLGEAPADGEIYARNGQAGSWVAALPAAGAGRNLIHNSLFNIAQRGAGPWTANTGYTADRWQIGLVSDVNSVSVVTLADADRAAIGDEAAEYCLQDVFTGTSVAGAQSEVIHKIEDMRRLSGKTVILSFWARATAGTPKIGIAAQQYFGSGGSATVVAALGTTAALSSTWTRYVITGAIPSVAGKTFAAAIGSGCTALEVIFSDYNNATWGTGVGVQSGTIQLWGMQLEIAAPGQTQPSPLQKIDPREDLANCQRFYCTFANLLTCGAVPGAPAGIYTDVILPVTMRAAPSVTFGTIGYTNATGLAVNLALSTDIRLTLQISAVGVGYAQGPLYASADL